MRSLSVPGFLLTICLLAGAVPAGASSVLMAECSRLVALGQTETAYRILLDIYRTSSDEEDRFEAANLLALFPPGTAAYKDRAAYAAYVLQHRLAGSRLSGDERFRMVRTEGLGWFSAGKWDQARKAFEELRTSGTGDDREIAALHLGWIEINLKHPAAAVALWLAVLEKTKQDSGDTPWRASMVRDLGRAWAESGGAPTELAMRVAAVAGRDPQRFFEGLKLGLHTIAATQETWKTFRATVLTTELRAPVAALLVRDPVLLKGRECELLDWLDRKSVESPELQGIKHDLEVSLRSCWKSGRAAGGERKKQLHSFLSLLIPGASSRDRLILGEVLLDLGSFDEACREYAKDLMVAPDEEPLKAGERACRKSSPAVAAELKASIIVEPKYFGLLDALFSAERNPVARQKLLEVSFRKPSEVAKLGDARPALWWLDALNRPDEVSMNAELRQSWSGFFLTDASIWESLPVDPDDRILLLLELSRTSGNWLPLYDRLGQIEKAARHAEKVRRSYSLWLDGLIGELLRTRGLSAPKYSSSWSSAPEFAAVEAIRSASIGKKVVLRLLKKDRARHEFLNAAGLFLEAWDQLNRGSSISLSLKSARFFALLTQQLKYVEKGSMTMRKAVAEFDLLRSYGAQLLNEALARIQTEIAGLEAPEDWPEDQKTLWLQQRVELGKLLEQRKVL